MKTRCPNCQTSFRVTPEQLKARAGKVRCGQCQGVFNALDSLLEEVRLPPRPAKFDPTDSGVDGESLMPLDFDFSPIDADYRPPATPPQQTERVADEAPEEPLDADTVPADIAGSPVTSETPPAAAIAPAEAEAETEAEIQTETEPEPWPEAEPPAEAARPVVGEDLPEAVAAPQAQPEAAFSASETRAIGEASGLIAPRETTRIPGYSKWSEELIAGPLALPEPPARWPFVVAALLLALVLAGQVAFRFRSELAVTTPALRPALAVLAGWFDADIPLPRHVELVSIESSDLQMDAAHANLLVLNATLRNRAGYGQAYPALELSLTDTDDKAIARRVFAPAEYLSPKLGPDEAFKGNSEIAVRLWIEAKNIAAAGYRLYVFYP